MFCCLGLPSALLSGQITELYKLQPHLIAPPETSGLIVEINFEREVRNIFALLCIWLPDEAYKALVLCKRQGNGFLFGMWDNGRSGGIVGDESGGEQAR